MEYAAKHHGAPCAVARGTMNAARLFSALPLLVLAAACSSRATSGASSNDGQVDAGPGPHPGPTPDGGPTPGPTPPYPADDSTVLVIGVDVEDFRQTLSVDLQTVHIVAKVDGVTAADETIDLRQGDAIPHETTLKAPASKKDAAVDVTIEGFTPVDPSGPPPPPGGYTPNVVRLASTHFVPNDTRILALRLEARCASVGPPLLGGAIFLGPTCNTPETCIAEKCASDVVDPATLPKYSKSWDTDMPDACRASPESMAIGGGDTDYAPIKDGDTVQIVEGGQCGHHVWVGVKMAGMRQYGLRTTISGVSPGNALTGPTSDFMFSYGDAGGGACEIGGLRYQLDAVNGGSTGATWKDFLGKPLDLTVKLADPVTGATQTSVLHVNVDSNFQKGPRPCGP